MRTVALVVLFTALLMAAWFLLLAPHVATHSQVFSRLGR